jgi:hypothetical protein
MLSSLAACSFLYCCCRAIIFEISALLNASKGFINAFSRHSASISWEDEMPLRIPPKCLMTGDTNPVFFREPPRAREEKRRKEKKREEKRSDD